MGRGINVGRIHVKFDEVPFDNVGNRVDEEGIGRSEGGAGSGGGGGGRNG